MEAVSLRKRVRSLVELPFFRWICVCFGMPVRGDNVIQTAWAPRKLPEISIYKCVSSRIVHQELWDYIFPGMPRTGSLDTSEWASESLSKAEEGDFLPTSSNWPPAWLIWTTGSTHQKGERKPSMSHSLYLFWPSWTPNHFRSNKDIERQNWLFAIGKKQVGTRRLIHGHHSKGKLINGWGKLGWLWSSQVLAIMARKQNEHFESIWRKSAIHRGQAFKKLRGHDQCTRSNYSIIKRTPYKFASKGRKLALLCTCIRALVKVPPLHFSSLVAQD